MVCGQQQQVHHTLIPQVLQYLKQYQNDNSMTMMIEHPQMRFYLYRMRNQYNQLQ